MEGVWPLSRTSRQVPPVVSLGESHPLQGNETWPRAGVPRSHDDLHCVQTVIYGYIGKSTMSTRSLFYCSISILAMPLQEGHY